MTARTSSLAVNSRCGENSKCPIWCRLQEIGSHFFFLSCTHTTHASNDLVGLTASDRAVSILRPENRDRVGFVTQLSAQERYIKAKELIRMVAEVAERKISLFDWLDLNQQLLERKFPFGRHALGRSKSPSPHLLRYGSPSASTPNLNTQFPDASTPQSFPALPRPSWVPAFRPLALRS